MNRNLGSRSGVTNFATAKKPVTSGVTVTDGDFVKLASGRFTNVGLAGVKLFGTVNGGDTENLVSLSYRNQALGNAGGTVAVLAEHAEGQRYELDVNGSLASDAEGSYYNLLNTAQALLTSTGTAPANNDTVTIGGQVYTFKTTLTGAAFEVLIGASAAAALDNLKEAVNDVGTEGTNYGTGTTANAYVTATTNTNTTQLFEAKDATVSGSGIAVSESSAQLSFDNTTLLGGSGGQMIDNTSKSATVGTFLCVERVATNAAGTLFRKGVFVVAALQSATTPS